MQHKKKCKKHERVCNDHDYYYVGMPNEENKILKYNYGEKSLKAQAIIYVDLEKCSHVKIILKSYTEKTIKHTSSGYSLFTVYKLFI